MKVTCESCGSKYTIKDDKVRGKRVKIRCKGCKSPIVVDGLQLDGSAPASADDSWSPPADVESMPPDAEGPGAITATLESAVERWSVNLSETDSRDMTTNEIVAAWRAGIVTDDAYIFKPGFDDWKPILEVPELAGALKGGSAGNGAAPDAFSPPAGASPFEPKRGAARAATSGRSGDLFGGLAAAGGEDDLGISGPPKAMPGADHRPTGARNEASVLFSLDALKAGFDTAPAHAAAPALGGLNDDPFGLRTAPAFGSLGGGFDQNQALLTAPAPEPKKPKIIASIAPAAPGEAPVGLDRNKLLMIAGGVLVLLIAVGGVGFALGGGSSTEEGKDESAEGREADAEKPAAAREGKEASEKEAKDEEKPAEEKKADAASSEEKKDAAADEAKPAGNGDKPTEATAAAAQTPAAGGKATDTKASATDKTKSTKTEAKPAADTSSAPPFNKSAAIAALSSAAGSAAGCKIPGGATGSGKVIVTFAPSGRVTSANVVGGNFGGTSVGGCVASRFRGARVPPFSGSPVTVSKSFSVK